MEDRTKTMIKLDSIEDAIEDIRNGKMIIVVDDESRENEGDFVAAAEMVSPEMINFMATNGRGLICVSLTEERSDQLELPLMVGENTSQFETPFTVSVGMRGINTFPLAPGTIGRDIHEIHKFLLAYFPGRKLRSVVAPDILRHPLRDEQIRQHVDYVIVGHLPLDPYGQALLAVFVQDVEGPESPSIIGPAMNEVVGPYVIAIFRPQPDT